MMGNWSVYFWDAIFAFRCMTDHAPTYLMSQFAKRRQISDWITKNSQQLNIPLFKTAAGQRSFHYRMVKLWNSLDSDFKLCKDLTNFQKTLKSRMLNEFLEKVKNSFPKNCRPTVDQQSAYNWPTVIYCLLRKSSANSRPTVGRLSADCWPFVGRLLAACR